jgi:hypothetical protein
MAFDVLSLQQESVTQGAETAEAKLAGLSGQGTLQVWRGQKHDVIRILGTWRQPEDENSLARLREALDEAQPVVYEGPVDDPARGGQPTIRTQVTVSSIGSYRLDPKGERSFCYVNFAPVDPRAVTA